MNQEMTPFATKNESLYEPRVEDLMTRELFTLMEDDNIKILEELMKWRRVRHVPVVNLENELSGLVTHRDLLEVTVSRLAEIDEESKAEIYRDISVKSIMKEAIATATPGMKLSEVAKIMTEAKIGCLPVVSGKKLVGIITEADFVKSFFRWNVNFLEN